MTKQRIKCLTQGHNTVPLVSLDNVLVNTFSVMFGCFPWFNRNEQASRKECLIKN